MKHIALGALALLFGTSALVAAPCDTGFEAELRVATEGMKGLEQAKRRLQARLDGQDFRITGLGAEADPTGLPEAPVLPELALPQPENGEGCSIAPARQTEALATAKAEIEGLQEAVALRGKLLGEVEQEGRIVSPLPEPTPAVAEVEPAADLAPEATVEAPPEALPEAAVEAVSPAPVEAAAPEAVEVPTGTDPALRAGGPRTGTDQAASVAADLPALVAPTEADALAVDAGAVEAEATDHAAVATPDAAAPAETVPEDLPAAPEVAAEVAPDAGSVATAEEGAPVSEQADAATDAAKPAAAEPGVFTLISPDTAPDAAPEDAAETEAGAAPEEAPVETVAETPNVETIVEAPVVTAAAPPAEEEAAAPDVAADGDAAVEASEEAPVEALAEAEGGAAAVPASDAAPAQDVLGPQPLTDPANPEAFIRVLAQPGMMLHAEAGASDAGTEVPVFSILYVFARQEIGGTPWVQVGRNLRSGPEGWVQAEKGVDWTNMLVMQFAPRGKRNQVLFFEEETALNSLVSGPFYQRDAQKLYDGIADERGKADPAWDARLVAIEPQTAVTYDTKPYLLPILDWRSEMFDGTTDTTLLRVAALPSAPSAAIGARDEQSFRNDARITANESGEFRVGVVFVIDTTISMRPFIERTRQAVEHFYDAFSKYDSATYVSFGLVGFRDNIASDPKGIEYVTHLFQPLDPEAPASTVLSNLGRVEEARASTKGFSEDAVAGITDALDLNDWSPYDAKVIVLVTDASARMGEGAKYPDMTLERLREKARQQNVTIIPLHLLTPANAKGDAETARAQYGLLAGTGDIDLDKYIAIDATDEEAFSRTIGRLASEVAGNVMVVNGGELLQDQAVLQDEVDEPVPADLATPEDKIAAVINNEIFRAQLETLGQIDDSAAPAFLSGWAADRDLTAPETETLEVSAFLTRNQLSTLDKRLEAIIGAFRSGGDNPQTFFANLQQLAAETATDPENIRAGDRSTIEAILPAYLKNLPYRSQVLRLDQAYWSSMSVAQQQEFIENLEAKRRIYGDIFDQTRNWADLGAGDPGLEATPVRLIHLP